MFDSVGSAGDGGPTGNGETDAALRFLRRLPTTSIRACDWVDIEPEVVIAKLAWLIYCHAKRADEANPGAGGAVKAATA